jgi:hypothetical protein
VGVCSEFEGAPNKLSAIIGEVGVDFCQEICCWHERLRDRVVGSRINGIHLMPDQDDLILR